MAGGNLGGLDFSLGIRDNFSKTLDDLNKRLQNTANYLNKEAKDVEATQNAYTKSLETVKRGINKLQYAWDDVNAAASKAMAKNPLADTSAFDKARDKIRDVATEFYKLINAKKFDGNFGKSFSNFFAGVDFEFVIHQIQAYTKVAQNLAEAQYKLQKQQDDIALKKSAEYWKNEAAAIERAQINIAKVGKEFMSMSKLKGRLMGLEYASPQDEAKARAAINALDGYIEKIKQYRKQYEWMRDAGQAQMSVFGSGGAAFSKVFTSDFWTAKEGTREIISELTRNWNALTAEQRESARAARQAEQEMASAAQNELNRQQRIIDMRNREDKALDDTTRRYIQLFDVLKGLQSVRSDRLAFGGDVTKLDAAIAQLLPKVRELHDAAYNGKVARTLYNSAASQRDIDIAKQLITSESKVNKEIERQIELNRKRADEASRASMAEELANRKANARMAVQADREKARADKANLRSFEQEERQIAKTVERYYELSTAIREARARIADARARGLDYSSLVRGLQPVAAMRHELGNAMRARGYSFNLYNSGEAKVQIDQLRRLEREYDKLAESQNKARDYTIANRDKVANITSLIDAMMKRWGDIKNSSLFSNVTLPSGFSKQIHDLNNLRSDLQKIDLTKLGSATDLLSRRHFGTLRREVNAVFSEIEKGYRKSERESNDQKNREERNIEIIKRSYARLFDQLNGLRHARANANILGIDTKELDSAIGHVLNKLHTLRIYQNGNSGNGVSGLTRSLMYADSDAKRELELVDRLIAKYQVLNADKRKSNADVLSQEASAARELATQFERVHNASLKTSSVVSDLKGLFLQGGIVYSLQSLVNSIIQTGGAIEQQHIALRAMLGDAVTADQLFGQIKNLAINSPFTFSEMIRDTKQLVAFGVEEQNVYDTTKRLADIAAGLGVSFERLGLAYGQVKSRGWLDGKELRQFAYAGLPLLSKLSALYSKRENKKVTTSDVRERITKRNVPFEDVRQVLWDMTDEGGQFFNMQATLSDTLLGKYNKLKDAWDIMLSGFTEGGNIVGKVFKGILDALAAIIQSMDVISPMLVSTAAFFGTKKLLGFAAGALGMGNLTRDMQRAKMLQMQQYASKQMELVLEGKISQKKMQQNLLARQNLYTKMEQNGKLYAQMALQGSLKPLELARLMNNTKQNAQIQAQNAKLIRQLEIMGAITRRQGQMILNNNRFGLAMNAIGGKLSGLFSFGNIAMAAMAAITAVWASANEFYEHNKEKGQEAAQNAANAIKNVQEQIASHGNKPLTAAYIGSLQEVLKQSSLYTTSLDEQISRAKTLGDKYDIIKRKIADARFIQEHGDTVKDALNASKYGVYNHWWQYVTGNASKGGGDWIFNQFFNEGIEDNLKDVNKAITAFDDLQRAGNATKEDLVKAKRDVAKAWGEIATDDVPRMVQSINRSLRQGGIAWRQLAKGARHDFIVMLNQIVEAAGVAGTQIGARLFGMMMIMKTHPQWLSDPKKMRETGASPLAIWMKYYNNNFTRWQAPSNDGGSSSGSGTKNKHTGAKKDKELEKIRNEVELYKKFYSEYKKLSDYVGEAKSLSDLKGSKDFKTVFGWGLTDVTDYAKSLDQLTASLKGTTEERRRFLNDVDASKATKSREDLMSTIKTDVQELNQSLDEIDKRSDVYDKIVAANGNRKLATSVAFGYSEDVADTVPQDRTGWVKKNFMERYGYSDEQATNILNMDGTEAAKTFGKDSVQYDYWQRYHKEELNDLQKEKDILLDLVTNHNTISEKIAAENRKYAEQLKALEKIESTNPEEYEKRKASITETHNQTIDSLNLQSFKQTSGWEDIFKDLDRVSKNRLQNLSESIKHFMLDKMSPDAKDEDVKTLVEALQKIQEHLETTSPFGSIANGYSDLSALSDIERHQKLKNGNYELSDEQASRFGLKKNANHEYSQDQLDGVRAGIYKGFENSIKGVEEAFKGLEGVLQPVASLFDAMGARGLSQGIGIASNAVSSAANTAGAFSTLSKATEGKKGLGGLSSALGNAGPYAAAAAAAISVASSLWSMKTASQKRYEKQQAYYKELLGVTNEIAGTLEKKVDNKYGSLSSSYASQTESMYQGQVQAARDTYLSWTWAKKHRGGHRNRTKTGLDYDELNAWLNSNGYSPGYYVGAQEIQNLSGEVLEKYRDTHAEAWAKMNSEARDYLETIIDIEGSEGKLSGTQEKLVQSLTDLNKDDIVSEYSDLLNELDSSNEDFADSLEKHLRNAILNGMVANLYTKQLTELYNKAAEVSDPTKGKYIDKYGHVQTHTGGDDSANTASEYTQGEYEELMNMQQGISDSMRMTRDMLRDLYGWSDSGSSSMSSSIKGMSENTGDILASYVNAIRADVSVIRQYEGLYLPKLDVTTMAQLQQLNMITANTKRSADTAERIEKAVNNVNEILTKSSSKIKPIYVEMK